jgi:hypothetical protein
MKVALSVAKMIMIVNWQAMGAGEWRRCEHGFPRIRRIGARTLRGRENDGGKAAVQIAARIPMRVIAVMLRK